MLLEQRFEQCVKLCPHKTAVICGEHNITYLELETRTNQLAQALIAQGVQRGDRVAVYLDNSVPAIVCIWGILKAGAVFMLINPSTKADKLLYILNHSRAAVMITTAAKAGLIDRSKTIHLRHIITTSAAHDYFDYEVSTPTDVPAKRCIDMDLASLVYTSGSTGDPKGVMLSHLNMLSALNSITEYLKITPNDIILNCLPLAFDYGLYQALMALSTGATLVLERSFTYPHAVMQKVVDSGATGFPIVPTMLAMLLQMDLTKYDLSKLRYMTNTGAALPTEHIRQMTALLPHVEFYSMYGLTECKRVSFMPPEELRSRPNSVGRGMPNEEVYIVDAHGTRVPAGVTGELVVRGSNVMKGYWEDPAATALRLKPGPLPGEMVLYTGDLFYADSDGYLYFVGRKDDMIKSRGEKVSPKVENILYDLAGVAEAAVVGVEDPIYGQKIKAFVALRQGYALAEKEIMRHCAKYLEDFMIPQIVEILETLPKGATGKIDKKALLNS
jgi:amino acid adenylation domain-containing protein